MFKASIPLAIQIVIDDVGWWSGADDSSRNGPYRNNICRDHHPLDYAAIVELGRSLGMKPQAAFILCEWDKENILRELPSSTWQGREWDNSRWVGPWQEEALAILREGADHFEFVLHGIGHEYWTDGKGSRAEWHDQDGNMRPRDQVSRHLDYYTRLMQQHQMGPFPISFVPAAFLHAFGLGADGLVPFLRQYGIKFISTPFRSMACRREPENDLFGIDDGMLTVNRGSDLFPYNRLDPELPSFQDSSGPSVTGPVCGMHWPNILHADPEQNQAVVARWVDYLKLYDTVPDMMLAPDTASSFSQLVYSQSINLAISGQTTTFDFSCLDKLPSCTGLLDSFYCKTAAGWSPAQTSPGLQLKKRARQNCPAHTVWQIQWEKKVPVATINWQRT